MLSPHQRTTILELHRQGMSKRHIARTLKLSRLAVRKVIGSASEVPPRIVRSEKAEPYRQEILQQYASCRGNLVRVHEELLASGCDLSYAALTGFCRRHGIGQKPLRPVGQYHFDPGEEIQHDTSPHRLEMAGQCRTVQTASAVLCYSRLLFFQCFPTFQRFDCKVFLTEALRYFGGACRRVMIDNTHVVVLRGTGAAMIAVPEMIAFGQHFGFQFCAHEVRDANRSGRVERPFSFIERNFLAGRKFTDWPDLNRRARVWCDQVNRTYKKHLRAIPWELFVGERPYLQPLPGWIPEVYRLHHRLVDVEGYVSLHTNRYSVPFEWIGRQVQIRETQDRIDIQYGSLPTVRHPRLPEPVGKRITCKEHRPVRGQGLPKTEPRPEEKALLEMVPELDEYLRALQKHSRQYITVALRHLLRLAREYPRDAFLDAVEQAARYGLYDLDRLERMILRRVAGHFFPTDPSTP